MRLLILLLNLLGSAVVAQSNNSTLCPKLESSAIVPEFNEYPLPSPFVSAKAFDDFLLSQTQDHQDVIDTFRNVFACPHWKGAGQRYYLSSLAALLVNNSAILPPQVLANAPINSTGKPVCASSQQNLISLCQDTCLIARKSISSLFDDPSVCMALPVDNQASRQRDLMLRSFDVLCRGNVNSKTCLPGIALEFNQCGFAVRKHAEQYCHSGIVDSCCDSIRKAESNTIVTPSNGNTVNSPGINGTTSSPMTDTQRNSPSTEGISVRDVAVIIFFMLLLVGCVFLFVPRSSWFSLNERCLLLFRRQQDDLDAKVAHREPVFTHQAMMLSKQSFQSQQGASHNDKHMSVISITEEFSREFGSYFKE